MCCCWVGRELAWCSGTLRKLWPLMLKYNGEGGVFPGERRVEG